MSKENNGSGTKAPVVITPNKQQTTDGFVEKRSNNVIVHETADTVPPPGPIKQQDSE